MPGKWQWQVAKADNKELRYRQTHIVRQGSGAQQNEAEEENKAVNMVVENDSS